MNKKAWQAQLKMGKKMHHLGTFACKQEAGVVWDAGSVWRSIHAPGKHALAAQCIANLPLVRHCRACCRLPVQDLTTDCMLAGANMRAGSSHSSRSFNYPQLRLWEDAQLTAGL